MRKQSEGFGPNGFGNRVRHDACVISTKRDAPTSPSTVHSSRFPRVPCFGPLGATARSVANSGGVPGALLPGNGLVPVVAFRDGTSMSPKVAPRGPKSARVPFCAEELRVEKPPPSSVVATDPSFRIFRTRIFRRGAVPIGTPCGPGGAPGRSLATLIARTEMCPFWSTSTFGSQKTISRLGTILPASYIS